MLLNDALLLDYLLYLSLTVYLVYLSYRMSSVYCAGSTWQHIVHYMIITFSWRANYLPLSVLLLDTLRYLSGVFVG